MARHVPARHQGDSNDYYKQADMKTFTASKTEAQHRDRGAGRRSAGDVKRDRGRQAVE
jgi:hypothetical protein